MMASRLIDRIGEANPQLFREIKGRLTSRNLIVTAATSLIGQFLIFLYFLELLPVKAGFNRYCTGTPPANVYPDYYTGEGYCIKNLTGQWMVLKQLWWLDIFVTLSVMGILALLTIGTYLLIADLSKEESRGTLNFIRLSPETAKNIFIGKIFGVPSLLYLAILLVAPLHSIAGLAAGIPLHLIVGLYATVFAGCAFFYSAGLVFSLATGWLGGFQPWLGSVVVFFFTFFSTIFTLSTYRDSYHTTFDWLTLFYPGTVLPYLMEATFLPLDKVGYFGLAGQNDLTWYGHLFWTNAFTGMGFIILQFSIWTYCFSKALKRRFHNPIATLLSKPQSYAITACFSFIGMGFVLQNVQGKELLSNLAIFNAFLVPFFLILMMCLSPHRQVLQDWARYRHQEKNQQNLFKELLLGDKSPSTLCLGLNLLLVFTFVTPMILLSPLEEYKLSGLFSFFLGLNMILIYGLVSQWLLLQKNSRRAIAASGAIALMIGLPLLSFVILGLSPIDAPFLWSFTVLPIVAAPYLNLSAIFSAMMTQWLALIGMSLQMTKQLGRLGASASKTLIASRG